MKSVKVKWHALIQISDFDTLLLTITHNIRFLFILQVYQYYTVLLFYTCHPVTYSLLIKPAELYPIIHPHITRKRDVKPSEPDKLTLVL